MKKSISISTYKGGEIRRFADDIAKLRIEIFREYPYLYDGNAVYEREYLEPYMEAERAAFTIAFAGGEVIGASTCIPLNDEDEVFKKPFEEKGQEISAIFYFGESVLKKEYRGRGIGVEFFRRREAHAFSFPEIRKTAFCAVDRPADHPLKPEGYQPLHIFWRRRGYRMRPDLSTYLEWKDIDQQESTNKRMVFWEKDIRK